MRNKFCVSKTLVYIFFFVILIFGAFYIINVINTQRQGANPEAAAKICKEGKVKGVLTKQSCADFATKMRTPFHPYPSGDSGKANCCIPEKLPIPTKKEGLDVKTLTTRCQTYFGSVIGTDNAGPNQYLCTRFTGGILHSKNPDVNRFVIETNDFLFYCETRKDYGPYRQDGSCCHANIYTNGNWAGGDCI